MKHPDRIKIFTRPISDETLAKICPSQYGLRARILFRLGHPQKAIQRLLQGIESADPEAQAVAFAVGDRRQKWIQQRLAAKDRSTRTEAMLNLIQSQLEQGDLPSARRSVAKLQNNKHTSLWKEYITAMKNSYEWIAPPSLIMDQKKQYLLADIELGWFSPAHLQIGKSIGSTNYPLQIEILQSLHADVKGWAKQQWKENGFQVDLAVAISVLGIQNPECQAIAQQSAKCLVQYDSTNAIWQAIYYRLKVNTQSRREVISKVRKQLSRCSSPTAFLLFIEALRIGGYHHEAKKTVEKSLKTDALCKVAHTLIKDWETPQLSKITIHQQLTGQSSEIRKTNL